MDPKEREIRQRLKAKHDEARAFLDGGKTVEAKTATAEARAIKDELETYLELRELTPPAADPAPAPKMEIDPEGRTGAEEVEYRKAFLKALRGRTLTAEERNLLEQRMEKRAMTEASGEDGGLIVPQDITTNVRTLMRDLTDLSQYVNVEPVTTLSGSRVIEKDADTNPFADIETENTDLGEMDNPKFVSLTYSVKARGGILPISNSLLSDTDQNLMSYLSKWIAKKSVATKNKFILAILNTLAKKDLKDLKAIKKVINVDLDPAIASTSIVITNQDGYNYLDTLQDNDGKFILQPDPTQPKKKLLFGLTVVVVKNAIIPTIGTTTKKAPLIIGNLKELITMFDRQQFEIKSTDVGGKAFSRNTTDIRVIQREDYKLVDKDATVYGLLVIEEPVV